MLKWYFAQKYNPITDHTRLIIIKHHIVQLEPLSIL